MGNCISGLVALLGFEPVESVVLGVVSGGALDRVLRADLCDVALAEMRGRLAELVACGGGEGVVAVVVSAEGSSCPVCEDEFRKLAGELAVELEVHGVQLLGVVVVDRIEAGAVGGIWTTVAAVSLGTRLRR